MRVSPIVKFVGEHYFLSNFYSAPVKLGNLTFKSNEAAFQAAKYKVMTGTQQEQYAYIAAILECDKPGDTKKLGKRVSIDLDKWEQIKVRCMRDIVRAKLRRSKDQAHGYRSRFASRRQRLGRYVLGPVRWKGW
jgi:predicted NAD-dependent protein-ADP-ribosyltransferase YbiA (DUF1768 family)